MLWRLLVNSLRDYFRKLASVSTTWPLRIMSRPTRKLFVRVWPSIIPPFLGRGKTTSESYSPPWTNFSPFPLISPPSVPLISAPYSWIFSRRMCMPSTRSFLFPPSGTSSTGCCSPCCVTLFAFVQVKPPLTTKLIMEAKASTCSLDQMPKARVNAGLPCDPLPNIIYVINSFLLTGAVPTFLKIASVTPIPKKPGLDPHDFAYYQPIANFPFLIKEVAELFHNWCEPEGCGSRVNFWGAPLCRALMSSVNLEWGSQYLFCPGSTHSCLTGNCLSP